MNKTQLNRLERAVKRLRRDFAINSPDLFCTRIVYTIEQVQIIVRLCMPDSLDQFRRDTKYFIGRVHR